MPDRIVLPILLAAWLAVTGIQEAAARTPRAAAATQVATQAACTVDLAHGGRADYRDLTAAAVKEGFDIDTHYFLPETRLGLDVVCGAPVALVLSLSDARAATRPAPDVDDQRFGLGLLDGRPIGVFSLSLDRLQVVRSPGRSLAPVHRVLVRDQGTAAGAWSASPEEPPVPMDTRHAFAFAARSDAAAPMTLVRLKGELELIPMIAKTLLAGRKTRIVLDGAVILAIEYV